MTTLSRLSWSALATPWQCCIEEAWSSYREGSVPIGAVLVDSMGRVVSRGRNRRADGSNREGDLRGHPLAHAELNALLHADASHLDLRSCSLYSSMEPCPLCTGALAMAHVGRVEFAARDLFAGSMGLLDANAFLRSRQIDVAGPSDPRLEEVMLALNVDFWLRQPSPATHRLIELWRVAFPAAVELGERVYDSATLETAAREGLPANEVLALL